MKDANNVRSFCIKQFFYTLTLLGTILVGGGMPKLRKVILSQ